MYSRIVIILIAMSLPVLGWATTDLPAQFGGRSVGLGGTGAAYLQDGSAVAFNPASLEQMDKFVLTFGISPFIPSTNAPFPNTTGGIDQYKTKRVVYPLFVAGVAYRLPGDLPLKPIIAAGIYPTAGFGSQFDDVDIFGEESVKQTVNALEMHIPLVLTLMDGLSLSVGWRATRLANSSTMVDPMAGKIESELSGWNFVGFSGGVFFQPINALRLSLAYRSKADVDSEGTTKMAAPPPAPAGTNLELDTKSSFAFPHTFRLGTALSLLNEKLMLTLDLKLALHKEANKEIVMTMVLPDGTEQGNTMKLDWKNVFAAYLGVEYAVIKLLALRLGYCLSTSATPEETANQFLAPPGLLQAIHAGTGLRLKYVDIDLGGFYAFANADVPANTENNVVPGEYSSKSFLIALSGTLHL